MGIPFLVSYWSRSINSHNNSFDHLSTLYRDYTLKNWIVYIVQCSDNSLYTGITNDLHKRILTHNKGKGAKYTRSRLPVVLKAVKEGLTKSEASKLEYQVKQQKKQNKIKFLTKELDI
mgnify:CR=1 FL=1